MPRKIDPCGFMNRKRFTFLVCLVTVFLALSGCMVGPDYTTRRPNAQKHWNANMTEGLIDTSPGKEKLSKWWKVFDDPTLTRLEKQAAAGNLGLKRALSRLRQARLKRGISKAGLFPALNAQGLTQKQRSSESMQIPTGGETQNYYLSNFDASWELDLFGGIRRSVQAAQAEIEASQAKVNDVLISLMADVALNYFEVRTYQQRLRITQDSINTLKKTYELNRSRYQAGLTQELTVQESLRNLERTRAQVSRLESGLRAAKNRLAVLLGLRPGSLSSLLTSAEPIPEVPTKVAVGIPAETMRRRPDIRMAERRLAAQTARVGVATARLYPKFHLFGTIGLEAIDAGNDFFDTKSRFWNIGPGMTWNIFHGRELRLNIKLQSEKQKEALINYKATVLDAQKEIENALTAYAKEKQRMESLKKAVTAAKRTQKLAMDRYQAGLVDFYHVLDAQRKLLQLRNESTQSKGKVASTLARLYKALGGGWMYRIYTTPKKESPFIKQYKLLKTKGES